MAEPPTRRISRRVTPTCGSQTSFPGCPGMQSMVHLQWRAVCVEQNPWQERIRQDEATASLSFVLSYRPSIGKVPIECQPFDRFDWICPDRPKKPFGDDSAANGRFARYNETGGFEMPIHDWTRVPAGLSHDFYQSCTVRLKDALNAGGLPTGVTALVEQRSGAWEPDVLAIENRSKTKSSVVSGGLVTVERPKTQIIRRSTKEIYAGRANRCRQASPGANRRGHRNRFPRQQGQQGGNPRFPGRDAGVVAWWSPCSGRGSFSPDSPRPAGHS
jgi:hypothetical protein